MDWIEQLFGVSPDGGDGGLERLIAVAAAFVLVALASRLPAVRTALVRLLGRRRRALPNPRTDSAR